MDSVKLVFSVMELFLVPNRVKTIIGSLSLDICVSNRFNINFLDSVTVLIGYATEVIVYRGIGLVRN